MSLESHQCPYCELRFTAQWELKLHLDEAHPDRNDDTTEPRGRYPRPRSTHAP